MSKYNLDHNNPKRNKQLLIAGISLLCIGIVLYRSSTGIDPLITHLILLVGAGLTADRILRVFLDRSDNQSNKRNASKMETPSFDERKQLILLKAQAKTFQLTFPAVIILLYLFSQDLLVLFIIIGLLVYIMANLYYWHTHYQKEM